MKAAILVILSVAALGVTTMALVGYFRPFSIRSATPPWETPGVDSPYNHPPFYEFRNGRGYFTLCKVYPAAKDMPRSDSWTSWNIPLIEAKSTVECLGLFLTGTVSIRCHAILPFAVFASFPVLVLIRNAFRNHKRRKMGLCLACGYDLTGNVSGACPECGKDRSH